MLNDREIDKAAADLANFQKTYAKILDDYASLLVEHKRLKSDYEEERETREKYKQLSKDSERNPFVLVLIDGDGYPFHDNLLSRISDGGGAAAKLINDRIRESLYRKGLDNCAIMVRVYANVSGLSKALSKTGVVGADSRSLAPFIANFNRSYGLTEFIDAGQLKENSDFKIRALLKLYGENAQCKHIYLAACHDVGYVSELTQFRGRSRKFTLIDSTAIRFHDEFHNLGMGIEELPGVFRASPLGPPLPHRPLSGGLATGAALHDKPATPTTPATTGTTNNKEKNICLFYTKGDCRYGKMCKNLHVDSKSDAPSFWSSSSSKTLRATSSRSTNLTSSPDTEVDMTGLPRKADIAEGHIAVNANNHRLDPYIPPPDSDTAALLKARTDKRRVCNSFLLNGSCDAGLECNYDHSPMDPACLSALESLARSQPCPKRGACKKESCTHGHICQVLNCKHRGGKVYCKIPYTSHLEDLNVARYIQVDNKNRITSPTNNHSSEDSAIFSF
ncbi:hypothetical protein QBC42DRAFT_84035 [Cladorrhinum samala]|uniref:C3H1-type domain-containing protein n=1 Tax=Cladorrhinum samala TaxID=585594 RepID=A0AAV9HPV2_9PEZI|nr:hypothetical protein QBC42DRAFT_84035 [Cladorrhinum samala]